MAIEAKCRRVGVGDGKEVWWVFFGEFEEVKRLGILNCGLLLRRIRLGPLYHMKGYFDIFFYIYIFLKKNIL